VSLCVDTQTSKGSEYENSTKKRGQHTFVLTNSDHFITPGSKAACACLFRSTRDVMF
jgi:hypothetical protein